MKLPTPEGLNKLQELGGLHRINIFYKYSTPPELGDNAEPIFFYKLFNSSGVGGKLLNIQHFLTPEGLNIYRKQYTQ
jgi:hypothetical protein